MYRRNPTRIELKLEDQTEYDQVKREMEEKKHGKDIGVNTDGSHDKKESRKAYYERLGLKMTK